MSPDETEVLIHKNGADELCLSVSEVFDYLPSDKTSIAHAYGASIFALIPDGLKLSKFQIPDLSKNAFFYSMVFNLVLEFYFIGKRGCCGFFANIGIYLFFPKCGGRG